MKVILATDHTGYELKEELKKFLEGEGYDVVDVGAHEYDKTDDFPDYIIPAAEKVSEDPENNIGIILGGSGQGEQMAANKVPGVRTALFYGPRTATREVDASGRKSEDPYEMLRLTREHNQANVLSLGARFIDEEIAKKAVKTFIEEPLGEVPRHVRRVNKVKEYENSRLK